MRLVLVFGLFVGLGAVPLWPLVFASALGLVLDAGLNLGSVVGELALFGFVLRLGAVAARGLLRAECGFHVLRKFVRLELFVRPDVRLLHVCIL